LGGRGAEGAPPRGAGGEGLRPAAAARAARAARVGSGWGGARLRYRCARRCAGSRDVAAHVSDRAFRAASRGPSRFLVASPSALRNALGGVRPRVVPGGFLVSAFAMPTPPPRPQRFAVRERRKRSRDDPAVSPSSRAVEGHATRRSWWVESRPSTRTVASEARVPSNSNLDPELGSASRVEAFRCMALRTAPIRHRDGSSLDRFSFFRHRERWGRGGGVGVADAETRRPPGTTRGRTPPGALRSADGDATRKRDGPLEAVRNARSGTLSRDVPRSRAPASAAEAEPSTPTPAPTPTPTGRRSRRRKTVEG
jgi:hypothetical protein